MTLTEIKIFKKSGAVLNVSKIITQGELTQSQKIEEIENCIKGFSPSIIGSYEIKTQTLRVVV